MTFRIYLKENKSKLFKDFHIRDFSLLKKPSYNDEIILYHKFSNTDHKKTYGKNIIIGGSNGFLGSILLSARAAIKTGSRYFIICTNKLHAETISLFQNELITLEYSSNQLKKLNDYKVVIIGPGLSKDSWSESIFTDLADLISEGFISTKLVVDAGFLFFLSSNPYKYDNWVLTPHEGEASMLLNRSPSWISANRIEAACLIQEKYSGTVVLKGPNTIIFDGNQIFISNHGGHYMGVAGMGDALTGVMASFIHLMGNSNPTNAILLAVGLHSLSADTIQSQRGSIGILPSDVIEKISELVNTFHHDN